MVELISDVGELLNKFPSLAIWILAGVLFYKTAILGTWFGIFRLLILKTHDVVNNWGKQPKEVSFNGILCQVPEQTVKNIILKLKRSDLNYVHGDDIADLEEAVDAVLLRRNKRVAHLRSLLKEEHQGDL